MSIKKIGDLDIEYNDESGQILVVRDCVLNMQVISFQPGHELEVNRLPLPLRLLESEEMPHIPAWQVNFRSLQHPSIGCHQGFDVFRQVVVGSVCNPGGGHINPPKSLHIRYRLDRAQINRYAQSPNEPESAGQRPIQMPLWLDTIGTLCARTDWFGPETRMLQSSIGGGGPRSHVGHVDGLVKDVVPHLWNHYRRTHPGVQMIPGAVYHHPDGRWLWITCQRPSVGMHWDFETDRLAAQFQYHARLQPAEIVHTPEVSLYWGCDGRPEMLARLNENFIAYKEPADWFFHTTWFWLHCWQFREHGYDDIVEQIKFLNGELGLTGFGITSHDVRPGCFDCATAGLRPSPHLGGDAGIRKVGETVRALGGKMYVWLPFAGLSQPGMDLKDAWRIKGDDGRPYESFYIGLYDMYHGVNYGHPEVQAYYLEWIQRYIREYKIEGIFWDCGGVPFPPDFSDPALRPFQRFPSESMTAAYRFMERVMQVGRECSPDFFMWHECFSQDLPGMAYSTATGNDAFLMELNRCGRRRLVFRSTSIYNLYGGFATVSPGADTAFRSPVSIATYRPMASDSMNKWLVKFVRENGIRDAIGLQPGVALCKNHVVVDPSKEPRKVLVPPWAGKVRKLRNVLTGKEIVPESGHEVGTLFLLNGATAYSVEP